MLVDIKKLFALNLINFSKLGALMYPNLKSNDAGAKLRNKLDEKQGQRITDNDTKLIEDILR